ncbi:MAG: ABC-type uncharacterized transport system permease subunit [Rhodothermales bacterium]|jgi:ABC-type uncharacterized transport system permease subunit
MIDLFFKLSMPFAAIGLLAFILYGPYRKPRLFACATLASFACFLCLSVVLIGLLSAGGASMLRGEGTRYILFAWAVILIYFVAEFRLRVRLLGSIVMPFALVLILAAMFADNTPVEPLPLKTIPVMLHIGFILAGDALIILAFGAAICHILKANGLKDRNAAALDERLPPLTTLERHLRATFNLGFPLFTVGMILGIIYAASLHPEGWFFDRKMLTGIITWAIYGTLFSLLHAGRINARGLSRGVICLFIAAIAAFLFSTHSLDSVHPADSPPAEIAP